MKQFKISFPSTYSIEDISNSNIDMMVVFDDDTVYYATLFTVCNIQELMEKNNEVYFWAQDMFIVKDLAITTIRDAVEKSIKDEYFCFIFDKIGTIQNIYGKNMTYEQLVDAAPRSAEAVQEKQVE